MEEERESSPLKEEDTNEEEKIPQDSTTENDSFTLFIGNISDRATSKDLEELFSKYGPIKRLDFKNRYAFVLLENNSQKAMDELHNTLLLDSNIHVERSRTGDSVARHDNDILGGASPGKCLFVVGFDPQEYRESDIEKLFTKYGKIVKIDIRRSFAFVEFETMEEAKAALELNNTRLPDTRRLVVEYVSGIRKSRSDRGPSSRRYSSPRRYYRSRSRSPRRSPRREFSRRSPRRRSRSRSFERDRYYRRDDRDYRRDDRDYRRDDRDYRRDDRDYGRERRHDRRW